MKITDEQIIQAEADGRAALAAAPGKTCALVYPHGFVPNAYKWPAPAERLAVYADGSASVVQSYDRKRSRGAGSYITLWKGERF